MMQKDKKTIRAILLQITKDRSTLRFSRRADEAGKALCRLVEGTYGICEDCGKNIPAARLNEIPEAARCLECQSAREGIQVEACSS